MGTNTTGEGEIIQSIHDDDGGTPKVTAGKTEWCGTPLTLSGRTLMMYYDNNCIMF